MGKAQASSRPFFQLSTPLPDRIAASSPQNAPGAETLELGQSVEREIAGVQTETYEMKLSSNQFAAVTVQQLGIDVVVRLFEPDGKLITEVDDESRPVGQEVLEFVSLAAGRYRIEIKPRYESLPAGRYQIRIAELRSATERDISLDQARRLHAQAKAESLAGNYDEAAHIEQKALAIRQRILGSDDLVVASSLFGLGLYNRNAGHIPEAEESYLEALAIREKALGPDHPAVSLVLNNLAYLYYYNLHDYERAQSMYERSLAIKEKALGPEHPLVAMTLNNMGLLQWKKGDYRRAETYYQRAVEIFEKNDGPDSDSVAAAAHNLGIVYKESGDYLKGEAYYRQALNIWEKTLGEDHPRVALALESLGILYRDKGDYKTAEPFLQRSLDIQVKKNGANHPDVAGTLVTLASLYEAEGDIARAVQYQSRAAEIEEKNITRNLLLGSERQKLAYFSSMADKGERRISLHVLSAPNDPKARDLALTMVLQRKGRVLDALADTSAALRRELAPQDRALLDDLYNVTERLSRLVFEGPAGSRDEHEKAVKTLETQREQLEEELSRRSAGSYQPSRSVTVDAIRGLLPDDAALIEFAVYHPSDPKVAVERDTAADPRYVAYIVRKQGDVQWKELGPAKDIDALVAAWRDSLRDPSRKDTRELARAMDEKLMRPLRVLSGLSGLPENLLISPDGALNLIPFAALVDEQGRYLVQQHTVSYLTSGRDLLRMQVHRDSKGPAVVIADPAFGEPSLVASETSAKGNSVPRRAKVDYSHPFFGPLPGAADEVRTLRGLIPRATFLTKDQATKAALENLSGPRVLHIATHGFFLAEPRPALEGAASTATVSTARGATESSAPEPVSSGPDNPLLRSGLALAGANQGNDGILTALEASGLNLWGTKLVVLSACDTGVGEVRNGEGVYGLRRALVLAGAETQVMSLWPVSDRSTRELIAGYYQALLSGAGRSQALREIQLQMLKLKPHPFYWASFIQAGEWANLEGKR
ncbi:MAG TPA: CHAT domain-containing tetratricopeptide repeat protein [Blastocatellia bacterium]